MMFKAVAFRDSRDSLHLGLSMWRLSWITFIFLPLTFTVGVFGMSKSTLFACTIAANQIYTDVDTFESNPSIVWWVLTSSTTLLLVLVLWYAVKHGQSSHRKSSLRRAFYGALYKTFAKVRGDLWTEQGYKTIEPINRWETYKWNLIKSWFGDDKL